VVIVEIAATGAIAAIAGSDFLLPDSCKKRLLIVDAASHPFPTLEAGALFKSASSIGPTLPFFAALSPQCHRFVGSFSGPLAWRNFSRSIGFETLR